MIDFQYRKVAVLIAPHARKSLRKTQKIYPLVRPHWVSNSGNSSFARQGPKRGLDHE
jgi:hypothetical protein